MRFLVGTYHIRGTHDATMRHVIGRLDEAGIGIASGTYGFDGLPPVRIGRAPGLTAPGGAA